MKHISRYSYMLLILYAAMAGGNVFIGNERQENLGGPTIPGDGQRGDIKELGMAIGCFLASGNYIGYARGRMLATIQFHENGVLMKRVKRVFEHLQVSISSLEEAEKFAQENLLRKGERWEKQTSTSLHPIIIENRKELLWALNDLGMLDAWATPERSYVYALLMGSLRDDVVTRLALLAGLERYHQYSFQELCLLGSERLLRNEEKEGLPAEIFTEIQMMKYLCETHPQFQGREVLLINAPMIEKEDGTLIRPTTEDTLVHFARIAPQPGACLLVSNNPYIRRQSKMAQRILDQSRFPTAGIGSHVKQEDMDIIMLMDEFARTLHEEYVAFVKSKAA